MDLSFLLVPSSLPTPQPPEPPEPDMGLADLDPLSFLEVEVPLPQDADVAEEQEVAAADPELLAREAREQLGNMETAELWRAVGPAEWVLLTRLNDLQAEVKSLTGQEQRDFVAAYRQERTALLAELTDLPKRDAQTARIEGEIGKFRAKVEQMEAKVAATKAALVADAAEAQGRRARYAAQFGASND